jgi:acetylornithine deacetylase/succinyl-diaminopimelate desuccinylase-like protein
MDDFRVIKETIGARKEAYINHLFDILRQPSISSLNEGVQECAALLKEKMEHCGIKSRIMETEGSPIVYGEVIHPDNDFTLLIYGHYDVQPPDPIAEWITPPFEPTIRDGKIYARGAGDNKGQLIAHVLAVKTLLDLHGKLPINVKMIFDGEEESSSKHFQPFVETHLELLRADLVYTADGPMDSSGKPMVLLGCRGMLSLELSAIGASHDNHSGNKGNIAPNPAWTLIHLLESMCNKDGKVIIEDFYKDVRKPSEKELELLRSIPFEAEEAAKVVGVQKLDMDGEAYYRKTSLEPTFNINGLVSGYMGEGQKTIIPSTAKVRLDIRLAADQDPEDIYAKIERHVKTHAPDVHMEKKGSTKPSRTPVELEVVQTVINAVNESYGEEPIVLLAIGATFPGYVFTDILKLPSILVPYANADEDNHAPNENLDIDCFMKGIQTTCKVLVDLRKYDQKNF